MNIPITLLKTIKLVGCDDLNWLSLIKNKNLFKIDF